MGNMPIKKYEIVHIKDSIIYNLKQKYRQITGCRTVHKTNKISTIEYKWDGKIRSPRELFRMLNDFLDQYKYEHEYHPLQDTPGAIGGTSTFSDQLKGKKDRKKKKNILLFIGIILLLISVPFAFEFIKTIASSVLNMFQNFDLSKTLICGFSFTILDTVGILCISYANRTIRRSIILKVEGETYRAKAEQQGSISSEVFSVVSVCRVVFIARVGQPQNDGNEISKPSKDDAEWTALREELYSLVNDFQKLRPKIQLPGVLPQDT